MGTGRTATIAGLDDAGTVYVVQVQARNAEGTSDWSDDGGGSTRENTPPAIRTPSPLTRGASGGFDLIDDDGLPRDWTVTVAGLPAGMGYSPAEGRVVGRAPSQAGEHEVTVTVDDGVNGEVTETFTLTVRRRAPSTPPSSPPSTPSDRPSTFTGDTTGSVTEDDAGSLTASGSLSVTDPDEGDTPAIEAQTHDGTYGSLSVASGGAWSYTLDRSDADTNALDANESATDTFTVRATDDNTQTIAITVAGANDTPAAPSLTDQVAIAGEALTYTFPASADPEGHTITYTALLSDGAALPSWLAFDPAARTFAVTASDPSVPGGYDVTVTASDGQSPPLTSESSFRLTVTAGDIGRRYDADGDGEISRDEAIAAITDYFNGVISRDETIAVITLYLAAQANKPPVITDPGPKTYEQGEAIAPFPVEVVNEEADDTLTVTVDGLPDGLGYDPGTGAVSGTVWSDAGAGEYAVTISANDGVNPAVTADFTITVTRKNIGELYDADGDGEISRDEAIAAITDYFDGVISREEAIRVITLYFASAG